MTTSVPRVWRGKQERYRLAGAVCSTCNHKMFPPREVCPQCTTGASQPWLGFQVPQSYFDRHDLIAIPLSVEAVEMERA